MSEARGARPAIGRSATVVPYRLWTRPLTVPQAGQRAEGADECNVITASPESITTSSTTKPAGSKSESHRSDSPCEIEPRRIHAGHVDRQPTVRRRISARA